MCMNHAVVQSVLYDDFLIEYGYIYHHPIGPVVSVPVRAGTLLY